MRRTAGQEVEMGFVHKRLDQPSNGVLMHVTQPLPYQISWHISNFNLNKYQFDIARKKDVMSNNNSPSPMLQNRHHIRSPQLTQANNLHQKLFYILIHVILNRLFHRSGVKGIPKNTKTITQEENGRLEKETILNLSPFGYKPL